MTPLLCSTHGCNIFQIRTEFQNDFIAFCEPKYRYYCEYTNVGDLAMAHAEYIFKYIIFWKQFRFIDKSDDSAIFVRRLIGVCHWKSLAISAQLYCTAYE